jgi:hypothetical protein
VSQVTRRRLLTGAVGVTLGGLAVDRVVASGGEARPVPVGAEPAALPRRQHAWEASLDRDAAGNVVAPRHDRLLLLDLKRTPTAQDARRMEAALRALEREWAWRPSGLLTVVGWGPGYFRRWTDAASPIPRPTALADFEDPTLDDYDCCVHLAADDDTRLAAAEAALLRGHRLPSGVRAELGDVFEPRETRTGFAGTGLPARRQDVEGIPAGRPVPRDAPLFMGFRSGLRRNQASEDDVTIATGPFAGGTTMHVSSMRLRLDSWYEVLDERERVARMYGPDVTPSQAAHLHVDAASRPSAFARDAVRLGVVGHAQTSARARRNGRPLILRRDFNTTDGGHAGLHFVSLQRSIDDFVRTRRAMNAARAATLNPAITDTVNNGINEFIFVVSRANYLVPGRAHRALPMHR